MRWSMKINSYNFDIFYKSGKKHSNADAMSRLNFSVVNTILNSRMALPANVSSFKRLQRGDKTLSPIIDYLEKKHSHHEGEKEIRGRKRLWRREIENFIIDKSTGLLYHLLHDNPHTSREDVIWQIVIPRALVPEILFLNHDHPLAGHLGTTKTYYRIRRQYFWKNMYAEVDNYCQSCEACATRRLGSPRPIAPLGTLPAVSYPFERIAVDVVGPFPRTNKGNRVLVVFVDHFTKWPEAFAVPNQEAKTIARLLVTEIISRYSIPRELLSDRGTNFLSKIVQNVCHLFRVHKLSTTAYNPKCNGGVERHHRVIMDGLAKYCAANQKDWDDHIDLVLFAYRSVRHASTMESPFFLVQGRDPQFSINRLSLVKRPGYRNADEYRATLLTKLEGAFLHVRQQLIHAHEYQKRYYDQRVRLRRFEVGDKVFLHNTANKVGFSPKLTKTNWKGPYRVIERKGDLNYRIRHCTTLKEEFVNVNRLKPAIERVLPSAEMFHASITPVPVNPPIPTPPTPAYSAHPNLPLTSDTIVDMQPAPPPVPNLPLFRDSLHVAPFDGSIPTFISPPPPARPVRRALELLEMALGGIPYESVDTDFGSPNWTLTSPEGNGRVSTPTNKYVDNLYTPSPPPPPRPESVASPAAVAIDSANPVTSPSHQPDEMVHIPIADALVPYTVTKSGRACRRPDFFQAGQLDMQ